MKIALWMLWFGFLMGCTSQTKTSYSEIDKYLGDLALSVPQNHLGKQLMENNCYLCHNPRTPEESIIAPPMLVVKNSYLADGISKEEFVENMVSWIKNPSKETSKMPEAIDEFGMMPYQFYPEASLRKIAAYIFDNEIEKPEWFEE